MKRKKGIRVPGIRNRLNGDDDCGLYALMDWYTQSHLTMEQVRVRMVKYANLYHKLHTAYFAGRNSDRHHKQVNIVEYKMLTLAMVLKDWHLRKF
jgi:hypothetical protein